MTESKQLPTHNLPISMRQAAFKAYRNAPLDDTDTWVFYDAELMQYWKPVSFERGGYQHNLMTPLDVQQPSETGPGRDTDWVRDSGYHPYKESVMLQYRFNLLSTTQSSDF